MKRSIEAIAKLALEAKFDDFDVGSVSRKLPMANRICQFARNRIRRQKRKFGSKWSFAIVSIVILCLALAGCSENSPSQEFTSPPVPVRTANVVERDVALYFEEMGSIIPYRMAEIRSQVSGLITAVHFKEGEGVTQGELLYSIEEVPYAIKVQEAEAQLSQNLASLHNAKRRLERYQSLSKQDLIAKVEWEELETKIALCEGMVKADEARLGYAKLDLSHCHILAPISGKAGKTSLQAGNMTANDITLLTVVQEEPLYVDFSLTEKELHQLPDASPSIEVYAAGGEECLAVGEVTFLDHTIDPKSGMIAARGLLSTIHKRLFAGQSVRVRLFFGKRDQAKLVPLRAIKTNQSGPYVFSVKEDSTVELHTIKLGHEEKGMIVVEEGLGDAKKIVTEGQLRLFPGSKVEEAE